MIDEVTRSLIVGVAIILSGAAIVWKGLLIAVILQYFSLAPHLGYVISASGVCALLFGMTYTLSVWSWVSPYYN